MLIVFQIFRAESQQKQTWEGRSVGGQEDARQSGGDVPAMEKSWP